MIRSRAGQTFFPKAKGACPQTGRQARPSGVWWHADPPKPPDPHTRQARVRAGGRSAPRRHAQTSGSAHSVSPRVHRRMLGAPQVSQNLRIRTLGEPACARADVWRRGAMSAHGSRRTERHSRQRSMHRRAGAPWHHAPTGVFSATSRPELANP